MNVIRCRNVHQILPAAIQVMAEIGVPCYTRNGTVLQSPEPVATVYECPNERVEFWGPRDSNPFFHFFESLWMLAGHNDVEPLAVIVPRMRTFSDDEETLWGAYGHRWRRAFAMDQLNEIVMGLTKNPNCRRQVLQMWSASLDLGRAGKDVPCNVTATFQIGVDGMLHMTVFCRSNDIIWGAYGANAVHFSALLEYMACRIGVPVGRYTQISVNWHAYHSTFNPLLEAFRHVDATWCPYESGEVVPFSMMRVAPDLWEQDLHRFVGAPYSTRRYNDPFFGDVAMPILHAHRAYKVHQGEERFTRAKAIIDHCAASDWRVACMGWLLRREAKQNSVEEGRPA